jgi:Arylsulfatase regulator (Fe-S oxidoreductase)
MIQSFIHKTENNNLYIYDDQQRLSVLIHPRFEKVHEKSTALDSYYLKKFEYLKKHGFFSNSKPANFLESIDESIVKNNIFQLPHIVFEVTNSCNLDCTYCCFGKLYEGYDTRNFKNINTHKAIKLLEYIVGLRIQNKNDKLTISFYGGEPLLNINFIKRIVGISNQLISEKEINIDYQMTTNATLIHKHIDFLVLNNFRLLISLDGNEVNQSYRVFKNNNNSFQRVIENISIIQRDYPEYFIKNVDFNAVLHDRNSVKSIYEFIYSRYHKIPQISELSTDDFNLGKKDVFGRMFRSKSSSENEYQKEESNQLPHNESFLYKESVNFLKYFSINSYISNITSLLQDTEKCLPTSTCLPFSKKMFLSTHNELITCERIDHIYSLGKITKEVMIDTEEITRQYNEYYNYLKNVCQHCYAYKFCGACMFRIRNFDKSGTKEFVCDSFYDKKAFEQKLYHIFSFLEKYPNDFIEEILENLIIK